MPNIHHWKWLTSNNVTSSKRIFLFGMPNIHHCKWLTSNNALRRRTIQPGPPPKPARQYLNQVIFWQKLSEFKVGKPFFSHWNIFTILYDEQSFSQSVANLSERSGVEVDSHNNAITRSSSRFVSMAKFDRWFNQAIKWFSVIIHHHLTTPSMLSCDQSWPVAQGLLYDAMA